MGQKEQEDADPYSDIVLAIEQEVDLQCLRDRF